MGKPTTSGEMQFLTYASAGRFCSCSRWTLYRAAKAGQLRRYGSAASPRFAVDELTDWMRRGAPTTADEAEGSSTIPQRDGERRNDGG